MPRRSAASSWNGRSGVATAALRTSSSSARRVVEPPRPDRSSGRSGRARATGGAFCKRLGEGAADGHGLAHRLHPGAEHVGDAGKLLEGPPGHLGDHVVDGRLEARRRLPGDVVADLVEACSRRRGERRSWRSGSRWPWRPAHSNATTRGFISMTTMSPSVGLTANWMLEPPVSTPMRRMQAKAASRICWYSTSESVWAGATVIESPVWTPIGSKFSIEQMTTQLSARSRMTSSSYSFQPAIDRSMRISRDRAGGRGPVAARRTKALGVVGDPGAGAAEDERRAGR